MTQNPRAHDPALDQDAPDAWPALFAMAAGFFMIMIDTTIVSVSIPSIMTALHADVTDVIWVSSAYLLTYAIPLLVTGRMGDRFGPKRVYLVGLLVFTLTSLWCGLSGSISSLIAARAVQGLGAAMMSPQTMTVITRMFPPTRRGAPMGLWGATASVAGLTGPLLGGLLVDSVGWEWIFFVNVPIGVLTILAVWKLVPDLPTHEHSFDLLGVVLSAVGLTMMVFGIQEGQSKDWPAWIIALIAGGVVVMGLFLLQQSRSRVEPLMPLELFKDRNFSVANIAILVMGACVVAMSFPLMLFLQDARGLTPTRAALLNLPSAVMGLVGSPVVGRLANSRSTRPFAVLGFAFFSGGLFLQSLFMHPGTSVLWMLLSSLLLGTGSCLIWGPLSMSATRDLPRKWAGAGSGVYNATRQLGSVLGSAAIATVISWQLSRNMPHGGNASASEASHTSLPAFLQAPYTLSMRHATWLPAGLALVALVACLFLVPPKFLQLSNSDDAHAEGRPSEGDRPASDGVTPAVDAPAGASAPAAVQSSRQTTDDGPVVPRRALEE